MLPFLHEEGLVLSTLARNRWEVWGQWKSEEQEEVLWFFSLQLWQMGEIFCLNYQVNEVQRNNWICYWVSRYFTGCIIKGTEM